MAYDYDIDILGALWNAPGEETNAPYAAFISANATKTNQTNENRILSTIEVLRAHMELLTSRDEARLLHYSLSRMLTSFGGGGFIYADLTANVTGNRVNAGFGVTDEIGFQTLDGNDFAAAPSAGQTTVAVGGTGLLSDLVTAINTSDANTNGGITASVVSGKLVLTQNATSSHQVVDVGGAATGATVSGLANTVTYTATVVIDGVSNPVSFTAGITDTYTSMLAGLNADLTGAVAALIGGNVVITSNSSGSTGSISITDVDLFSTLTTFVAIDSAIRLTGASGFAIVNGAGAAAVNHAVAAAAGLENSNIITAVKKVADIARDDALDFFKGEIRNDVLGS